MPKLYKAKLEALFTDPELRDPVRARLVFSPLIQNVILVFESAGITCQELADGMTALIRSLNEHASP